MSEETRPELGTAGSQVPHDESSGTLNPLPGEAGIPSVAELHRSPWSRKGLLAVVLLMASLIAVSAYSIHRFASSGKKSDDEDTRRASDRPSAATADPRRLDLLLPAATAAPTQTVSRIPAVIPTDAEAEPIGVRRTGPGSATAGGPKVIPPEDAPVLLVSSRPSALASPSAGAVRQPGQPSPTLGEDQDVNPDLNDPVESTTRNLQGYQRQLQGLLETLTRSATTAAGHATGGMPIGAVGGGLLPGVPSTSGMVASGGPASGSGLFGGQLQGSATARVAAATLGNRSLTLPKGTAFTCALKTKVISATSGLVGCQVQRNVFSDDGRVLLIERGSHMDGEYRIGSVRPGTIRIPVVWTRIRTPNGVTVDIDSPGTGRLGESGIDGYVDNRWGERIGAAMLLSLIDDSVKLVIQNQAGDRQADTIVLPSTTANTSKLAEKVLDSTINIPPLIYQNQGGIVGIYVARDVDFSSVYELKPVEQ